MSRELHDNWIARLKRAERAVIDVVELSAKLPLDPFAALSRLREAIGVLEGESLEHLAPPADVLHHLEDICIRERAEFWDRLEQECEKRNWSVQGSTDRRLIGHGIIVELVEKEVRVEELSLRLHPFAGGVADAIASEVDGLVPREFNAPKFVALLASAYEMVPGANEKAIELVYRASVLLSQRPVFWRGLQANQMIRLTRPAFRARIAQLLRLGTRTVDGREVRFGTTIVGRDAWELYSPGEERLVQVGRISLS